MSMSMIKESSVALECGISVAVNVQYLYESSRSCISSKCLAFKLSTVDSSSSFSAFTCSTVTYTHNIYTYGSATSTHMVFFVGDSCIDVCCSANILEVPPVFGTLAMHSVSTASHYWETGFTLIIDKHQHMHFCTFKTVLV